MPVHNNNKDVFDIFKGKIAFLVGPVLPNMVPCKKCMAIILAIIRKQTHNTLAVSIHISPGLIKSNDLHGSQAHVMTSKPALDYGSLASLPLTHHIPISSSVLVFLHFNGSSLIN